MNILPLNYRWFISPWSFSVVLILFLLILPTKSQAEDYTYTTSNGKITITGYIGTDDRLLIPSTIQGLPVTRIEGEAFRENALTSVTIPNSVTSIGSNAFYSCTHMDNVIMGNSVTSIGDEAFYYCYSVTNVTIGSSVTSIGRSAFAYCTGLTSVIIPDSVRSIGDGAFTGCSGVTKILVGNRVANLGTMAFFGCIFLEGVYFCGNAPSFTSGSLLMSSGVTVYYLTDTKGWGPTFADYPTAIWTRPRIANPGILSNQFGFTLTGAYNQTMVVEACTNLANPSWLPLSIITLNGGSFYFNDPQWTNYPARFFRLKSAL